MIEKEYLEIHWGTMSVFIFLCQYNYYATITPYSCAQWRMFSNLTTRARIRQARHLTSPGMTLWTPQSLLNVPSHFFPHACWSHLGSRHTRSIQACCVQTARVFQSLGPPPPSWSRRKNNVRNSCAARPFSAGKKSRRPATGCLVRRII